MLRADRQDRKTSHSRTDGWTAPAVWVFKKIFKFLCYNHLLLQTICPTIAPFVDILLAWGFIPDTCYKFLQYSQYIKLLTSFKYFSGNLDIFG